VALVVALQSLAELAVSFVMAVTGTIAITTILFSSSSTAVGSGRYGLRSSGAGCSSPYLVAWDRRSPTTSGITTSGITTGRKISFSQSNSVLPSKPVQS